MLLVWVVDVLLASSSYNSLGEYQIASWEGQLNYEMRRMPYALNSAVDC